MKAKKEKPVWFKMICKMKVKKEKPAWFKMICKDLQCIREGNYPGITAGKKYSVREHVSNPTRIEQKKEEFLHVKNDFGRIETLRKSLFDIISE